MPSLAENKQARYHYAISETWEAGIALLGHEVKSAKSGHADLKGSYVRIKARAVKGKRHPQLLAQLVNAYIAPYTKAGALPAYEPRRTRQLLFQRNELNRLVGLLEQKGLTLVPISLYTRGRLVKLRVGLGRGKSQVDRRETIKRRDDERRMRSAKLL